MDGNVLRQSARPRSPLSLLNKRQAVTHLRLHEPLEDVAPLLGGQPLVDGPQLLDQHLCIGVVVVAGAALRRRLAAALGLALLLLRGLALPALAAALLLLLLPDEARRRLGDLAHDLLQRRHLRLLRRRDAALDELLELLRRGERGRVLVAEPDLGEHLQHRLGGVVEVDGQTVCRGEVAAGAGARGEHEGWVEEALARRSPVAALAAEGGRILRRLVNQHGGALLLGLGRRLGRRRRWRRLRRRCLEA
mmetsp:Transcript_2988/g.9509  ORF Transcript_2988/g.9509 Transcript_2988/m.9509 type:complete len:249 (+) Transcript_2988:67-813(+)